MATTTTNYGFDVPTSSDLVKNGATAISTLGQDIDTFFFRPFTKNYLNNGGFNIWQRGTTFTVTGTTTFTADRFLAYRSAAAAGMTVSRSTDAPTGFTYSAKVQRDSGVSTTNNLNFRQALESQQSKYLAGKTVVVSFYAKAGADFSPTSDNLTATLISGTGTDQAAIDMTSWTGVTTVVAATNPLTTSWVRYSMTGTVASSANQIGVTFANTPVGTAGADDSYYITGIQIEEGNQASPFTMQGGTIQGELAACQRYYWRTTGGYGNYAGYGMGSGVSTTQAEVLLPFPVTMRTNPTVIDFSTLALTDSASLYTVTTITLSYSNVNAAMIYPNVASGLTQFRPYKLVNNNNSTTAYVGISAEL